MKSALGRFCAFAAVLATVVLAGYSQCHAVEPVSTVPPQVAAAVHIQHWGQILWGLVTAQTGTQTPSFGDPVFNPDGSVSQSFTTADGTEVVLTSFLDGSARLDITLPDGTTQVVLQSTPVFDGVSTVTIDWTITSSAGLSIEYTSSVDDQGTIFDISDDTTELLGSAVLPGGLTQTFQVLTAAGITEIESTQSDGSVFTLSVPLGFPFYMYPDFAQEAIGTYTGPGFNVGLTLASTPKHPSRWAALLTDPGGEVAGTFSLNADFSGSGQLTTAGTSDDLIALVSWTQQGESDVYLLSGEHRSTGPAGAALDYLEHRWLTLTALLAPAPVGGADMSPPVLLGALQTPRLFSDVPPGHWAYLDIYKTARAAIAQGYPDGGYHPDETVNRAQMAVFISRALAGGEENIPAPGAYPEPSFTDVPEDYWAYRHIEYASTSDVVRGYGDSTYRPDEAVDRAQMAVYVARAKRWVAVADNITAAAEIFPDVPADFWAARAIQACAEKGVVRGYADGCYHPDAAVTRDQMAVYIARSFGLM